jgi:hypothetical protein
MKNQKDNGVRNQICAAQGSSNETSILKNSAFNYPAVKRRKT